MKKQIRIGIADDHKIVLDGLVAILSTYESIKVVVTASNGQDLLDKIKTTALDVILLDLDMPVLSGSEALTILKNEYPDIKIIILSSNYNYENVVAYFKKGVNAFLPKDASAEKLLQAINEVYVNGKYADSDVTDMLIEAAWGKRPEKIEFTDREISIIKLICEDKSSKDIAEALSLSTRTVEYDRGMILAKLDARSVSAIVKYAIKHKIVEI